MTASARIRVMHFVGSFRAGGTERHVTNLLQVHDQRRFEISVGTFGNVGPLFAELGDLAEHVTEFPIKRLYDPRTWVRQLRLAAYLRANRIQVLHTHGFYPNCVVIPAARLAAVPVVLASIRDIRAIWTTNQRRAERWMCKLAHSVVTNAEAAKQILIDEGYDPDKITVFPNGIDLDRFREPARNSTLRKDLDIPADAPLVGVVARINECKGLEYFIEAAAIVSRDLPGARYVIVGGTPPFPKQEAYRRALEQKCQAAGLGNSLVFAGHRTDIPAILAELDISVLPSLSEGMPNAVLESMAAGVPTVATTVGGIPEIIVDEVSGLLVPPKDGRRLASAIERLLRSPDIRLSLGTRARDEVEKRFSRQHLARLTEEHYIQLLRSRKGDLIPGKRPAESENFSTK